MLGNTDGDLFVLQHGQELKELARNDLRHAIYTTPAAANGTLYIVTRRFLYALQSPEAATSSTQWPMFRGNPRQTGVAGSTLPAELFVRWTYDAGDAACTTAAIANGRVFVGGDNGKLVALDLKTGRLKWRYESEDAIESSPTAVAGLVVFGDEVGVLRACDAETGALRWTFAAGGRIVSSANPVGERLVFGSYDGHLYCLRIKDGRLLWKYAGVEERIHGTPGVVGERVLVVGCDARLHVVNLADGSPVRKVALGSVSGAAAAIRGARVFLGCYGQQVLGINWQTGRVLWRFEDPERSFPFLSSAAVSDDLVIVGGRDKRLRALDPDTGRQRWQFATKGRIDSSPVIVGERVFVGSADGWLYAVEVSSGKEVWRFETGGSISASPAVGAGCLVIGTEEGVIYCFGDRPTPANDD